VIDTRIGGADATGGDRGRRSVSARLDQIINMKLELAHLAGKIDLDWMEQIAPPPALRPAS
jgi:hypothetical protein